MRLTPCLVLLTGLFLNQAALATSPADPSPATSAAPTGAARLPVSENSVVKIFSTLRYPDPYRPWTKQAPTEVTGSGVIIEGRRILTNAHVVLYASQIQVQANQAGDKRSAKVEFIAPGIDLAILKLDDESLFATRPAVTRARPLPAIKDPVLVYGFPTGGTTLSITKGIISRIEFTVYNYPVSGLRIQIDAAINPGNSGGPAFVGDQMIGLAFSRLGGGDNIGYIIPNEEIDLFLADIADGRYDGKPSLSDDFQTLENPALRTYLKLDKAAEGLVVRQPASTAADYPLHQWDLVTKIGDANIDDQGMVSLTPTLRIRFPYLVQHLARDGKVPLTILRAGRTLQIDLPAPTDRPLLIPDLQGEYPSYFVYGPLVFSKATIPFMSFITNNANLLNVYSFVGSALMKRRGDSPAFPDEELVVVSSPFFPHKLAQGYNNPSGSVVSTVNGQRIRNLRHLVTLLRDTQDDYLILQFDHRSSEAYVFPRKEMVEATEEILNDNGVRAQGSRELMEIWNTRK